MAVQFLMKAEGNKTERAVDGKGGKGEEKGRKEKEE